MSAQVYTQEQLDIELLKQQSGTIIQSLVRIENELFSIDKKIDSKIDSTNKKIDSKIDSTNKKIDSNFTWLLSYIKWLLSFTVSGFVGMLGLMAHGFHWF